MLGNWLEQIGAVTLMNLRNLSASAWAPRSSRSFGVAGVVTVVVGVLSINEGFRARAATRRRRRRRDRAARRRHRRDDERLLANRDARDRRRAC